MRQASYARLSGKLHTQPTLCSGQRLEQEFDFWEQIEEAGPAGATQGSAQQFAETKFLNQGRP